MWVDLLAVTIWTVHIIQVGGGMCWIHLAQVRDQWWALVSTVMNLPVMQYVGKVLSSCTTGGFSYMARLHRVSQSVRTASVLPEVRVENL
jgi:hypothetical protein